MFFQASVFVTDDGKDTSLQQHLSIFRILQILNVYSVGLCGLYYKNTRISNVRILLLANAFFHPSVFVTDLKIEKTLAYYNIFHFPYITNP